MFLDKYKGQTGLSKYNSYIFGFPNKFINHFEKEKAFLAFLFCGAEKNIFPFCSETKNARCILDVSRCMLDVYI